MKHDFTSAGTGQARVTVVCPVMLRDVARRKIWGRTGGWHEATMLVCVPLAAPIGLSPLLILTLCGPERVLVVSTEPPDDLSCLTTPGVGRPGDGAVACAVDQNAGEGGGGAMEGAAGPRRPLPSHHIPRPQRIPPNGLGVGSDEAPGHAPDPGTSRRLPHAGARRSPGHCHPPFPPDG